MIVKRHHINKAEQILKSYHIFLLLLTEWLRWEGTSWDHLVQHLAQAGSPRVRTVPTGILSIFRDTDSRITLGYLFQCLTIPAIKNSSYAFWWNLTGFNLRSLPLILSLGIIEKSGSLFFIPSHQLFVHIDKLPQAFSSPSWTVSAFSASPHMKDTPVP